MAIAIFQVDAFTSKKFAGNPAAVCLMDKRADEKWMQQFAAETGLPATAFLYRDEEGYDLRWFTTTVELPLCGHGTLASAHVLFETGRAHVNSQVHFHTRSGVLSAWRNEDWNYLDLPSQPVSVTDAPSELGAALGNASIKQVYRNHAKFLVELATEKDVRTATPDFALIRQLPCDGVVITSAANTKGYDFVSRYFAPSHGIDEDAVTGSAHCALAPFWAERLAKDELVGYQASARGGTVRVRMNEGRVELGGQAIIVIKGELM